MSNTMTNAAANEKRLATMRANLEKLEKRADELLNKDEMTRAERLELLQLVNVAYHNSGKIDGCFSVDSCAACDFCQKMIAAAGENILMICGACYAAADAWKEAAWRRHNLNRRIFSAVLFSVDELQTLSLHAARLVRFNEDGDTTGQTMAQNYLRIARAFPAARFGYWYKNSAAVESGLKAEGITARDMLPKNVRFIHSSALIGFSAAALWFDDATFTVYPDAETTQQAINAGAWECNGRKCSACGYNCYLMQRRQEKPLQIAEVLRCSAARRKVVRAAYDARIAK